MKEHTHESIKSSFRYTLSSGPSIEKPSLATNRSRNVDRKEISNPAESRVRVKKELKLDLSMWKDNRECSKRSRKISKNYIYPQNTSRSSPGNSPKKTPVRSHSNCFWPETNRNISNSLVANLDNNLGPSNVAWVTESVPARSGASSPTRHFDLRLLKMKSSDNLVVDVIEGGKREEFFSISDHSTPRLKTIKEGGTMTSHRERDPTVLSTLSSNGQRRGNHQKVGITIQNYTIKEKINPSNKDSMWTAINSITKERSMLRIEEIELCNYGTTEDKRNRYAQLESDNLLKLSDVFYSNSMCYQFWDYPHNGCLNDMLQSLKKYKTKLAESEIISKLEEICDGLNILHKGGLTHGRLSTKAVFFAHNGCLQLADIYFIKEHLQSNKLNYEGKEEKNGIISSMEEVLDDTKKKTTESLGKEVSEKDTPINQTNFSEFEEDIRALGPILYQMATFRTLDFSKIGEGKKLRIMGNNNGYSAALQHLLNNLMTSSPMDLMELPKIIEYVISMKHGNKTVPKILGKIVEDEIIENVNECLELAETEQFGESRHLDYSSTLLNLSLPTQNMTEHIVNMEESKMDLIESGDSLGTLYPKQILTVTEHNHTHQSSFPSPHRQSYKNTGRSVHYEIQNDVIERPISSSESNDIQIINKFSTFCKVVWVIVLLIILGASLAILILVLINRNLREELDLANAKIEDLEYKAGIQTIKLVYQVREDEVKRRKIELYANINKDYESVIRKLDTANIQLGSCLSLIDELNKNITDLASTIGNNNFLLSQSTQIIKDSALNMKTNPFLAIQIGTFNLRRSYNKLQELFIIENKSLKLILQMKNSIIRRLIDENNKFKSRNVFLTNKISTQNTERAVAYEQFIQKHKPIHENIYFQTQLIENEYERKRVVITELANIKLRFGEYRMSMATQLFNKDQDLIYAKLKYKEFVKDMFNLIFLLRSEIISNSDIFAYKSRVINYSPNSNDLVTLSSKITKGTAQYALINSKMRDFISNSNNLALQNEDKINLQNNNLRIENSQLKAYSSINILTLNKRIDKILVNNEELYSKSFNHYLLTENKLFQLNGKLQRIISNKNDLEERGNIIEYQFSMSNLVQGEKLLQGNIMRDELQISRNSLKRSASEVINQLKYKNGICSKNLRLENNQHKIFTSSLMILTINKRMFKILASNNKLYFNLFHYHIQTENKLIKLNNKLQRIITDKTNFLQKTKIVQIKMNEKDLVQSQKINYIKGTNHDLMTITNSMKSFIAKSTSQLKSKIAIYQNSLLFENNQAKLYSSSTMILTINKRMFKILASNNKLYFNLFHYHIQTENKLIKLNNKLQRIITDKTNFLQKTKIVQIKMNEKDLVQSQKINYIKGTNHDLMTITNSMKSFIAKSTSQLKSKIAIYQNSLLFENNQAKLYSSSTMILTINKRMFKILASNNKLYFNLFHYHIQTENKLIKLNNKLQRIITDKTNFLQKTRIIQLKLNERDLGQSKKIATIREMTDELFSIRTDMKSRTTSILNEVKYKNFQCLKDLDILKYDTHVRQRRLQIESTQNADRIASSVNMIFNLKGNNELKIANLESTITGLKDQTLRMNIRLEEQEELRGKELSNFHAQDFTYLDKIQKIYSRYHHLNIKLYTVYTLGIGRWTYESATSTYSEKGLIWGINTNYRGDTEPTGGRGALGSSGGKVFIYDLDTYTREEIGGFAGEVKECKYRATGELVCVDSTGGINEYEDVAGVTTLLGSIVGVGESLLLMGSGDIVVGDNMGNIYIYDSALGTISTFGTGSGDVVRQIAQVLPHVVLIAESSRIYIWDTINGNGVLEDINLYYSVLTLVSTNYDYAAGGGEIGVGGFVIFGLVDAGTGVVTMDYTSANLGGVGCVISAMRVIQGYLFVGGVCDVICRFDLRVLTPAPHCWSTTPNVIDFLPANYDQVYIHKL